MPKPETIPDWIQKRQADNDAEEKKWYEEHKDYYQFPEGETEVFFNLSKPPVKKVNKFGKVQYEYTVKIKNEEKKISVNIVLDKAVIHALMEGMNPITIIRIGKGTQTRYSVKGLES